MSQFFSFISRFLQKKHTKSLLIFGGLILAGFCFGATDVTSNTPQYTETDLTKGIIEIMDLIFGLLAMVLGPMVILAGWLLSPDWTMGDFFGLRGYFKEVWILVANIVYIIFALMLLYMAIMQIFGGAKNEYAFKARLGPFLVGILMVPFTWLIVSWTLSFANQAVAAVLSIPMGSISKLDSGSFGTQDTSMWHKKTLPTTFDFTPNASGFGNMTCKDGHREDNVNIRCISPAEFLTYNQAGPFFIIMIYAYNIFKIQDADLSDVKKDFCSATASDNTVKYQSAKSCVQSLMGIVRKFGLALVVTIFFAVMLIALCWILLMRAIKLWIYIMLSPLFGLAYFTGEGFGTSVGEAGESGFGQVSFKMFFKLAMVPVLVSAVLAFGLLFVGVVRDNFHGGPKNPNEKEFCTQQNVGYMVTYCITEEPAKEAGKEPTYYSRLIIGTDTRKTGEDSKITLNFSDTFSNIIGGAGDASIASAGGAVAGGISSVDDIFAHIILTMMALVFMFMGVQIAAKFDPVTEAAFKPFAQLGESVGNFVAHSPSYLPLPHPAFAALTPEGMKGLSTMLDTSVREHEYAAGKSAADLFDGKANTLNSALGNASISAQDLSETMRDVGDEYYKRRPEKLAAALTHSIRNVKTNDANELRGLIEANKGSTEKLGKVLEKRSDLIETVIGQSGGDAPNIRSNFDKAKQVGNVSANTNQERHVTLGNSNIATTVTGSPTSNLSINIGGQVANIPKLDVSTTKATNMADPGFSALKSALNKDGKLNVDEAKKILGSNPTSEQISALSRWIDLKE